MRKSSVEHLEQLALPNLDSDSQDSAFYRVETLYNTGMALIQTPNFCHGPNLIINYYNVFYKQFRFSIFNKQFWFKLNY